MTPANDAASALEAGEGAPPVLRLRKRADFVAARNGVRAHTDPFVLQLRARAPDERLMPGEPAIALRIGFTVTKKVGGAVLRNRIKRRLRAAVADISVPANLAGHDAVLIARLAAAHCDFADLRTTIADALAQGRLRLQKRDGRGKTAADGGRAAGTPPQGAGRPSARPNA